MDLAAVERCRAGIAATDWSSLTDWIRRKHPKWSEEELRAALAEYHKFLCIKAATGDFDAADTVSPGSVMDETWHAHIIATAQYEAHCTALFGRKLHHSAAREGDDDMTKCGRLMMTLAVYMQLYRAVPPVQYWGEDTRKLFHAMGRAVHTTIAVLVECDSPVLWCSVTTRAADTLRSLRAKVAEKWRVDENLMLLTRSFGSGGEFGDDCLDKSLYDLGVRNAGQQLRVVMRSPV